MNKIILFFLLIGISTCYSQIITIPDTNFKLRLLQCSPSNTFALSISGYYIKIDANNNGEIEQSEALMVERLNIINCNISNLEGLQYFTNLTSVGFDTNHIASVNLSSLTKLTNLDCHTNLLTSLDLTGLIHLERLFCYNNQITSLDFSNLPNLKTVYCGNNQLTSLDFSYNPLFEDLGCKNNTNLTSIKFKNNHQQLFGSQTFLNECWTGCPNLNYICADAFEIPALQSYLSGCGITQAITIDSACPLLGAEEFEKYKFTIFPNPFDSEFNISFDNFVKEVKLELFTLVGQKIYENTLTDLKDYLLKINNLASGTYLLKITNEQETIVKKIVKK
jgi:hypothetical protein